MILVKTRNVSGNMGKMCFGPNSSRGAGGLKPKNQSFRNRFSFKKLYLRNKRWGGGGDKSMYFLKALFKTYSKINVWLLLL